MLDYFKKYRNVRDELQMYASLLENDRRVLEGYPDGVRHILHKSQARRLAKCLSTAERDIHLIYRSFRPPTQLLCSRSPKI